MDKDDTHGKLELGRLGNKQNGEEREGPPVVIPLPIVCIGLPFIFWLRMWRERSCLVIMTWDEELVGEGTFKC